MLVAGARVMFTGGYGAQTYQFPGNLIERFEGHLSGAPCQTHTPPCVYWSVQLDTGSVTYGYEDQFTLI